MLSIAIAVGLVLSISRDVKRKNKTTKKNILKVGGDLRFH